MIPQHLFFHSFCFQFTFYSPSFYNNFDTKSDGEWQDMKYKIGGANYEDDVVVFFGGVAAETTLSGVCFLFRFLEFPSVSCTLQKNKSQVKHGTCERVSLRLVAWKCCALYQERARYVGITHSRN